MVSEFQKSVVAEEKNNFKKLFDNSKVVKGQVVSLFNQTVVWDRRSKDIQYYICIL